MLIKCVCSNCGHSYLSDDEMGDLACPRCNMLNEGVEHGSDLGGAAGMDGGYLDPIGEEAMLAGPIPFEAKAPPPMYVTRERLMRGMIFGSVLTAGLGAVLGAALVAVGMDFPVVTTLVIGFLAGTTCRSGFGGRSARQTKGRALLACTVAVLIGYCGFLAGTWGVERLTGSRADQTHEDLDRGLKGLTEQYAVTQDAGASVVLKQRIEETRRLSSLSDPQLEDYLWVQQAQINQPLLAFAKLRFTEAPVVKLGPDRDAISVRKEATLGIRLAEVFAALILAARAVRPKS